MSSNLAIRPILSEKSHSLSNAGTYLFEVPLSSNKLQVKTAVQAQFEVTVTQVRTARLIGKSRSGLGKRSRSVKGKDINTKRAYVTLKEGDNLPFFEPVDNDHDHDHKTNNKKKVAKKTKAETK